MPRDLGIGLTAEQKENRKFGLGGSDANTIMSGDAERIYALWQEKRGEKEPENLDDVLPVVMGQFTEALNVFWFEKSTGRTVSDEQRQVKHEDYAFMACTLDGMTTTAGGQPAVFEAKHVNAFSKIEEVVQRYMPQLHHNMAVSGLDRAVLSVFVGTQRHEIFEIEADFMYTAQLIDAEKNFWSCVQSGEAPVQVTVAAPATPGVTRTKTIDMTGNNEWAAFADDFIQNNSAAKKLEDAKKGIKALIPDDVKTATGHGIKATVAKNNSVTITEEK